MISILCDCVMLPELLAGNTAGTKQKLVRFSFESPHPGQAVATDTCRHGRGWTSWTNNSTPRSAWRMLLTHVVNITSRHEAVGNLMTLMNNVDLIPRMEGQYDLGELDILMQLTNGATLTSQ